MPASARKSRRSNPRGRPRVDTEPLDRYLGFHVRLAMMTMRRSFFRTVADGEIHPGLASLLQLVAANPEASQIELARALRVNKATLVSLLDKAEQAGWLYRERSRRDRRRHVVRLTPAGKAWVRDLTRQMMRHERKFLSRFSEQELATLVGYLQRIYDGQA